MAKKHNVNIGRRQTLKTGAVLGAASVLGPYVNVSRAADTIKIGMLDPQTGTYAALGGNEINGAHMALEQLNAKNGILGRQVELLVEDTAADVGTAVQKTNKLVDRDNVDLLMGAVSSAVALAISQAASQKGKVYMVTGGHTDGVTGKQCRWNTFRICTTTWMLAAGIAKTLADKFGKKWYFITPDYAFGHTEQAAFAKLNKQMGGQVLGNALAPLGTTDFSSYLIKAKSANPDVLVVLQAGNDLVNCLKQASEFGMTKSTNIAGGLMELEVLKALPDPARLGWWTFEWWWNQPDTPHVKDFVDAYRKKYNSYPTARSWFGFAGVHALALGAEKAGTVDQMKIAKALEGLTLPPEVALEPNDPTIRAGDHQLLGSAFPGQVKSDGKYPDLFDVARIVPGKDIALSVSEDGCKIVYPS
ncbi:MAG: ABC transporter substrate-binding protein [Arenicellales bacterium]